MSADKRNDDQEMSMEEILASIRRYVSDEAPETNLKEGSIEYNSGKTADVIRLTEIIDSQEATIQTENLQNQQSNDGLDKAHQQARAETYIPKNAKVQQPYTQAQDTTPTPHQNTYGEPRPQQTQYNAQTSAYTQPAGQTNYNRRDPIENYGEQRAPFRPVDGGYAHPAPHTNQGGYTQQQGFYPQNYQTQTRDYPPPQQNKYDPTYGMSKPTIVSEPTLSATEQALAKLTQAFQFAHQEQKQAEEKSAVYGTSAIESFVIEMARPMIREWIDKHLPKLVDRLVTQEIEKLTEELRKKLL